MPEVLNPGVDRGVFDGLSTKAKRAKWFMYLVAPVLFGAVGSFLFYLSRTTNGSVVPSITEVGLIGLVFAVFGSLVSYAGPFTADKREARALPVLTADRLQQVVQEKVSSFDNGSGNVSVYIHYHTSHKTVVIQVESKDAVWVAELGDSIHEAVSKAKSKHEWGVRDRVYVDFYALGECFDLEKESISSQLIRSLADQATILQALEGDDSSLTPKDAVVEQDEPKHPGPMGYVRPAGVFDLGSISNVNLGAGASLSAKLGRRLGV